MDTLVANELYHIKCDEFKNRIYVKIMGFWKDLVAANEFVDHLKRSSTMIKNGFTVLVDLSEFKVPKPEVVAIIKASQKHLMDLGMAKSAEIVSESLFTDMAISQITKENEITSDKRKKFKSLAEAEVWLDE